MKILVAEDSATMRRIMEMTFAGEEAEVVAVESGEQAVEQVRSFQPDVVFADASMSGMDGYEVARALKSDAASSHVPVVLMASQHNPYDEDRGQSAGVDDHIVKPFDSQVVIDKARQFAEGAPVLQVSSMPPAMASEPPLLISEPPQLMSEPPELLISEPPGARPVSVAPAAHDPFASFDAPPPQQEDHVQSFAPPARPISAPAPAGSTNGADIAARLADIGLTPEQIEGVLRISAEVVERVVWEVVPDLAETLIREEIARLTR